MSANSAIAPLAMNSHKGNEDTFSKVGDMLAWELRNPVADIFSIADDNGIGIFNAVWGLAE